MGAQSSRLSNSQRRGQGIQSSLGRSRSVRRRGSRRREKSDRESPSASTSKGKKRSKLKKGGSKIKTSKFVQGGGKAKSKMIFTSMGYEGYIPLGKISAITSVINQRNVDYNQQKNDVNKSQLIVDNKIMNYDLDDDGGVAWTSQIPTFSYSTYLKHDIYHKNRNQNDQRNVQVIQYK